LIRILISSFTFKGFGNRLNLSAIHSFWITKQNDENENILSYSICWAVAVDGTEQQTPKSQRQPE